MEEIEFYREFEERLEQELLKVCSAASMLDGVMLASDDIDEKWSDYAKSYIADAIEQINEYPEVAFAWAGYIGMAVAKWWDTDWIANKENQYRVLYGSQGFDNMDDHIVVDILGLKLDGEDSEKITGTLYSCAQLTISMIRKENIEFGTAKAFYTLARAVRVLYRVGAAIQLKRMGYKFEKIGSGLPLTGQN